MPDLVTLVPEKRQELTTEGGLDVKTQKTHIREAIKKIHAAGIPVSLFINPHIDAITLARQIGADMVEIHTGTYANAREDEQHRELAKVARSIAHAAEIGLKANAGHGLNYHNVTGIAEIEGIRGLYIGHSIISRAVLVGMEKAVRDMKELVMMACPVE